jgi:single-stranded DNA-binding protein
MTTLSALIPRMRYRTGRVVAIRCATCRTWRKTRRFNRNGTVCHTCIRLAATRR